MLQPLLKWLRSLGPIGSVAADAVQLLTADWKVVVIALTGIIAGIWETLTALVNNRHVQAGLIWFLAFLWTYIGLRALRSQKRSSVLYDYAYSLATLGVVPQRDNLGGLVIALNFQNVGIGPIKLKTEAFRIIIGTTIIGYPGPTPDLIIPRASGKSLRHPSFPAANLPVSQVGTGTIEYVGVYGHPDQQPMRRVKFVWNIQVQNTQPTLSWSDAISLETDEQIMQ